MKNSLKSGVKAGQIRSASQSEDARRHQEIIVVMQVYRKDYPNGDHAFRATGKSFSSDFDKVSSDFFDLDCRSIAKMYPRKVMRIKIKQEILEDK